MNKRGQQARDSHGRFISGASGGRSSGRRQLGQQTAEPRESELSRRLGEWRNDDRDWRDERYGEPRREERSERSYGYGGDYGRRYGSGAYEEERGYEPRRRRLYEDERWSGPAMNEDQERSGRDRYGDLRRESSGRRSERQRDDRYESDVYDRYDRY